MLWIKAFHVIAMVCWFAGLFYLPRLYVYHALATDPVSMTQFKIMERKLFWFIMTPAAIATIVLGVWLLSFHWSYYLSAHWLQIKVAAVVLLIFYHLMCGYHLRCFAQDCNRHSHVYFRWFNEIPVILLITIVLLVKVQPFT